MLHINTITAHTAGCVLAFLAGGVCGWAGRAADLHGRAAAWAAARARATWFVDRRPCRGCAKHVHLMRHISDLEHAESHDDGYRCLICAGPAR